MIIHMHLCSSSFVLLLVMRQGFFLSSHIYMMDFSFPSLFFLSCSSSMEFVSHKDALMRLSMVRKYLEDNFTEYNSYYDIEDMIEKNALINRTQSKITDFFK
jgi:hypothetical protein